MLARRRRVTRCDIPGFRVWRFRVRVNFPGHMVMSLMPSYIHIYVPSCMYMYIHACTHMHACAHISLDRASLGERARESKQR